MFCKANWWKRERERELSTFWRIWKCHRSIACTSSRLFWKRFARSRRGLSPIHTFWPNLIRRWVQSKFGEREDGVYTTPTENWIRRVWLGFQFHQDGTVHFILSKLHFFFLNYFRAHIFRISLNTVYFIKN